MRPHVKRALAHTILAIEAEATAPYVAALREADRVLESLAAKDATASWDISSRVDFVKRAEAAHQLVRPLLARRVQEEQG
jgi:septum formation inhibitor-activating ATPase MinD